ncbi:hypothetical protein [Treponema pedis]|uniref:hypothetical protein n=1 Tax=Treponema pedis TaxID=409322 RepID=UPI003D1EAF66
MNEKKFFIFIICILLLFSGCRTASGIHDDRIGAHGIRDSLGEVGERQANAAITSTELKGEINRSLDEVGRIENTINGSEGSIEEFRTILERIRERGSRINDAAAGGD